jgi:hypothetical protein
MTIPFRYVALKNDHKKFIAAGYTSFAGSFDPEIYEEVFKPLPTNAEFAGPKDPMRVIQEVFAQAVASEEAAQDPVVQKDLLKLADVVERALSLGLYGAAREAILEPVLPAELEPYRQEMLDAVPNG